MACLPLPMLRFSPPVQSVKSFGPTLTTDDGDTPRSVAVTINQLTRRRSSYIWAATFDGLVRFDGVCFTVFNSATSDGLPGKSIIWGREGPSLGKL